MIVVCEGCARRFQLDESRIPKTGARVRCKHCHHRFRVSPPGDTSTEAEDPSATASRPISAEDTLFGPGTTGGAPIDGDRSLFGSLDDEPVAATAPNDTAHAASGGSAADEASGSSPDEESWGGLTEDLQFVHEPAGPDDTSADAVTPPPSDAPSASPTASAADEVAALEADSQPFGSDSADENRGGEDSWEFADSDLSLTESPDDEVAEEAAPVPESSVAELPSSEADAEALMQLDPGASHPDAAPVPGFVDETPSLRVVGPGAGPDAALFEMVEGEDEGAALELEEGEASAPTDAPGDAPREAPGYGDESPLEAEPPDVQEVEALDERAPVATEANPGSEEAEPGARCDAAVAAVDEDEFEYDSDPGRPAAPGADAPPSATARQRGGWGEHVGWALSLVLLLAVAQGTVRIEPALHERPPGEVEIAGLVAGNVRGRFVENARSGTLFVVSGELHNRGVAPRASGELRVVVLDEHGFPFDGRDAPIGPALAEARVRETPIGVLHQHHTRLARTLAEHVLVPGDSVSFQAILADLPENAVRFRLEAVPGRLEAAPRRVGEGVGADPDGGPTGAG